MSTWDPTPRGGPWPPIRAAGASRRARDPRTGNVIARQMFQWSRARGCDIYMFAFDTGAEVRVRYASTRGASEFLPTVWTDRIAFARVFERRRGRAGERAYLYVRPNSLMDSNGPRGRSQRVPAGARARGRFCSGRPRRCRVLVEPGPTALDLRTRRLAFGWDSNYEPTSAVYIDTLHVGPPHRPAPHRAGGVRRYPGERAAGAAVRPGRSPGLVCDVLRQRHRELRAPVPRRGTEPRSAQSCGSRPSRCSGRCWRAPSTNRPCSTSNPACTRGIPARRRPRAWPIPAVPRSTLARCAAPPSWCFGPASP